MSPLIPRRSHGRLACPTSRDAGFPVEIAGRPPHPLVFTRLLLGSLALRPAGLCRLPFETLSDRLGLSVTTLSPVPHYGADKHLPRPAPLSRLEQRALCWALTSRVQACGFEPTSPLQCGRSIFPRILGDLGHQVLSIPPSAAPQAESDRQACA